MSSAVVVLAVLCAMLVAAAATQSFVAHRMVQFDAGEEKYGSRASTFSLEMRHISHSSLERKCAVMRSDSAGVEKFVSFLQAESRPGAVVALLGKKDNGESLEAWKAHESAILSHSVPFPVYLVEENEVITAIHDELQSMSRGGAASVVDSLLSSKYLASVTEPDVTVVADAQVKTLQALLPGSGEPWKLPTIALVANYDTFGVFPDIPSGSAKASGAVGLLAAARLLGKLYSTAFTRPKYNILFLFTGGSAQNFEGSRAWLEGADRRLLDGIEYVLCLDSLSSRAPLQLHGSRPPKDGNNASRILAELQSAGADHDATLGGTNIIQVSFVHKKILRTTDARSWEHEHFAARSLAAGTLTTRTGPDALAASLDGASVMILCASWPVLTVRSSDVAEALATNARLVAEAVARLALNASALKLELDLVSLPSAADIAFAKEWLAHVGSKGHATQNSSAVDSLLTAFQSVLRKYPFDIAVKESRLSAKAWALYGPTTAILKVDRVMSSLFDGLLLPLVGMYLAALYYIVGKTTVLLGFDKVKRS